MLRRSALQIVVLLVVGVAASACVKGRAQVPEQVPALAVPPVPPRAIEPVTVAEPPVDPTPVEPPPPPPPVSRPTRARPPAEAKPDPKETSTETLPVTPAPPPVAPLRSAATPTGPEATRQIRDILDSTHKMLDKVDSLSSDDRKANYQQAKAFLQQADEALKKDELTQARSLAERAQNIAKLLLTGR